MKHTITINSKNNTQHITYLDQHITLQIKKLPPQTAYQIQDTPILITTTKTLQQIFSIYYLFLSCFGIFPYNEVDEDKKIKFISTQNSSQVPEVTYFKSSM